MYKTNNPVGSSDLRDVWDNADTFDNVVNNKNESTHPDRFGTPRPTLHGLEQQFISNTQLQQNEFEEFMDGIGDDSSRQLSSQEERFQQFLLSSGYVILPDYIDGPITFTARNQITAYKGEFYRPKASVSLPYTTTGNTDSTWFEDEGNFVSVGDALLRQEITGEGGYKLIGGLFSQEGMKSAGPSGEDLLTRIGKRGQYDVISSPYEKKASAGLTFGGDQFKGALLVDDAGNITVYSFGSGRLLSSGKMFSSVENTGLNQNGYPIKRLRMPSDGFEDNIQSPSLIIDYDSNDLPRLWVCHPREYRDPFKGAAQQSDSVSRQLADIPTVQPSIDFTKGYAPLVIPYNQSPAYTWVKIAQIDMNSGGYSNKAKFIVTSGNGYNSEDPSYLLTIRADNVAINSGNIGDYINLVNLSPPQKYQPMQVGAIVNGSTTEIYLKLSDWNGNNSRLSPIFIGEGVSINKSMSILSNEPSGIVYSTTIQNYSTANTTIASDGSIMAASPIVRVSTDMKKTERSDITNDDFVWCGSGCSNSEASGVSVDRVSTGTYLINGASLAESGWFIKQPNKSLNYDSCYVEVENSGENISLKVYKYQLVISNGEIVQSKSDLMDIPLDCWVDVRLKEKPLTEDEIEKRKNGG